MVVLFVYLSYYPKKLLLDLVQLDIAKIFLPKKSGDHEFQTEKILRTFLSLRIWSNLPGMGVHGFFSC